MKEFDEKHVFLSNQIYEKYFSRWWKHCLLLNERWNEIRQTNWQPYTFGDAPEIPDEIFLFQFCFGKKNSLILSGQAFLSFFLVWFDVKWLFNSLFMAKLIDRVEIFSGDEWRCQVKVQCDCHQAGDYGERKHWWKLNVLNKIEWMLVMINYVSY